MIQTQLGFLNRIIPQRVNEQLENYHYYPELQASEWFYYLVQIGDVIARCVWDVLFSNLSGFQASGNSGE